MSEMVRIPLGEAGPGDPEAPSLSVVASGAAPLSAGVLVFPGGGYGRRAAHEGEEVASYLGGCGFAAAVAHYRVAPHRHPVPLEDARRAMRVWRGRAAEWNLDPGRVAVLGFSAGGHLAATLATQPEGEPDPRHPGVRARPDAVALAYPVVSFDRHAHEGSVANLLGSGVSSAERAAWSADRNVTAASPPAFLFHTADDAAVPVQNSLLYAEACLAHGVACELHVFPRGRHGVGLAGEDPALAQWPGLLVNWLRRTLGGGSAG